MKRFALTRRQWLSGAGGGFLAFSSRWSLPLLAARPNGTAKRCLVLWMNGGPSQFETFDPKPGMATGGETRSIATRVPGLAFSEFLPSMAKRAERLAVLRCIESPEGEHLRAQYLMHTGYRFVPAFPRPALGSMVSHSRPSLNVPHYVTLGARGYGAAFLGPDHAAFAIEEPDEARELLRTIGARSHTLDLLRDLAEPFARQHPDPNLETRRARIERLRNMVSSPFTTALDIEREPASVRSRYGEEGFGKSCLIARRLLEAGVAFVEISHDGWDTHADNYRAAERLCGAIDRPWAQLLDDLQASGLLDETLIIWMGEFGRTPAINGRRGRDHFPRVTPVVLAGAGLPCGAAIGQTNADGTAFTGVRYRVADLFATVLQRLGIEPDTEYTTSFGSPTTATDDGKVIRELA